jgi:hypothetical protein
MVYYLGRWVHKEDLDPLTVYRQGWGKCPSYGSSLNLGVSRMCPLSYNIGELFGEVLTSQFGCGDWNNNKCPLASIQDRALDIVISRAYD